MLRPGHLIDDEPTGRVQLASSVAVGSVPRGDVAAVAAALLAEPGTAGLVLELVSGGEPVDAAVAALTHRA